MNSHASSFPLEVDSDGIATILIANPRSSLNLIDRQAIADLADVTDVLAAQRETIVGIVVRSAQADFSAGGDLEAVVALTPADAPQAADAMTSLIRSLRRLETLERPVVALLDGATLGAGLEIALSCHHRIAIDSGLTKLGLPGLDIGLLPGAGAVTRVVRMLGPLVALEQVLVPGTEFTPSQALEVGLVDSVAADFGEALRQARTWIQEHPEAKQPWDHKGVVKPRIPSPAVLSMLPAQLLRGRAGAPVRAHQNLLAATVESCTLEFDTALRMETRYCVELLCSQVSSNLIGLEFDDRPSAVDAGSDIDQFVSRLMVRVGLEGLIMRRAGAAACSVEQLAYQVGFDQGPTALIDQLTPEQLPAALSQLGVLDESTRQAAAALQSGLDTDVMSMTPPVDIPDGAERLLMCVALEASRCIADETVRSVAQANLESVHRAGVPAWTGGAIRYAAQYPGGLSAFVKRADELADAYGERFRSPVGLSQIVAEGFGR